MPHRLVYAVLPYWFTPWVGVAAFGHIVAVLAPHDVSEYAGSVNTAILLIGGTALWLWKQKSQITREEIAKDEEAHRVSLKEKLAGLTKDAEESREVARVAHEKAAQAEAKAAEAEAKATAAGHDRDNLWNQLTEILKRLPDSVCPFLNDGRAHCQGRDVPPSQHSMPVSNQATDPLVKP